MIGKLILLVVIRVENQHSKNSIHKCQEGIVYNCRINSPHTSSHLEHRSISTRPPIILILHQPFFLPFQLSPPPIPLRLHHILHPALLTNNQNLEPFNRDFPYRPLRITESCVHTFEKRTIVIVELETPMAAHSGADKVLAAEVAEGEGVDVFTYTLADAVGEVDASLDDFSFGGERAAVVGREVWVLVAGWRVVDGLGLAGVRGQECWGEGHRC